MNYVRTVRKLLRGPPLAGIWALAFGLAAIAWPTLLRWLVDPWVEGMVFLPYFPFVLLAALLLSARNAALVAVGCAAAADFFFMGHAVRLAAGPSDLFGIAVFLLSSALLIGLVQALRGCAREVRPARPVDAP